MHSAILQSRQHEEVIVNVSDSKTGSPSAGAVQPTVSVP